MNQKCFVLLCSLYLLSVASSLTCSDSCSQLIPPVNASCIISSLREVDFLPCRFGVATDNANPPCGVRVGQSVVVECDDDAAVLYRNGEPVGSENQSSLFIPFVQPDDEGVYGCRSPNDTLEQRNLTVNEETQVAIAPRSSSCFMLGCVEEFQCCGRRDQSDFILFVGMMFSFSVYGSDPEVRWETVEWQNHHGVDLRLQLISDPLSPVQSLVVGQRPVVVDSGQENGQPFAFIRVTASNNFSTSAACFGLTFLGDAVLFSNGSLPLNQTAQEGQDAVFQCIMKTLTSDLSSGVLIQYEPVNGTADPWQCVLFECACRGSCRSSLSIQEDRSTSLLVEYNIKITVPSVVPADSGAVVSCLLLRNNVTQWRGDATLTVVPAILSNTTTVASTTATDEDQGIAEPSPMLQYIAVAPSVLILLIGGVIIVAIIWYRRRVATTHHLVPLKAGSVTSRESPLLAVVETALLDPEGPPLPSITITSSGGEVGNGTTSGDRRASMDSGHCDSVYSMDEVVANENVVKSSSLTDLPTQYSMRTTRIYVSYSNCKSEWVAIYLKPLIESFPGTEVTIHDADMIAGQPISMERLRLIVEADKVVIVCSPDYAQSPWCQYELYQAIAKQPSLAEGRIIPVLCDGCPCPPPEVRAVVCLSDKDNMFPDKLKAALIRFHRSSY